MNLGNEVRGQSGISILWPDITNQDYQEALLQAADGQCPNNISAIVQYSYQGGATMLWMGDLETCFMEDLTAIPVGAADILFAPHHGRDSGRVPAEWLEQIQPKLIIVGEAPAEYLHYHPGYDTITQNSAGDITFECRAGRTDIYVSEWDYSVDFLTGFRLADNHGGKYIGSLEHRYAVNRGASMKYAVQLINGSEPLMRNAAVCFQGAFVRIRKIGDDWFLESSAFDGCAIPGEVFPIADKLLRLMQWITAVHARLFSICEIGYVQAFNEAGMPSTRGLRGTIRVQIISPDGIQELSEVHGEQSRGSMLAAVAMARADLQEALALVGDGYDLQWAQIYNILEFLGGADAMVQRKWATRDQIRKCKQTANHFRHLGSPQRYPLPASPPTQGEATILVFSLLRKWISEHFAA